MEWVINSYNGNTEWLKPYNPILYDKKDLNVGSNIYDYMDYIVSHYDNLPDVILFGKSNMLERHITPDEFSKIKDNKSFTPILTQHHKTDGVINFYKDELYYERNDSWYFNSYPNKYFKSYKEFAYELGLPNPEYLGFAPGACYIVPKENIHKHPKEFYAKLKEYVAWDSNPAEAHAIERSLVNIWL